MKTSLGFGILGHSKGNHKRKGEREMDESQVLVAVGSEIEGSYSREGYLAVFVKDGKRTALWRNTDDGYDDVAACPLDGGYFWNPLQYRRGNALYETRADAERAVGKYARRIGTDADALGAEIHKVSFSISMKWAD